MTALENSDVEGMKAYFQSNPDRVEAKAAELEADGREELAAYIRYRLALVLGEHPDPEDAETAGLPMPEELTLPPEGSA
jgi:arginine utilization protein RocB